MTKDEVRALIKSAWANAIRPSKSEIGYDSSGYHRECNQVATFFGGKQWTEIDINDLQHEYEGDDSACLFFMSAKAFAYYLPTYMLVALDHFSEADLSGDAAVAGLTPSADATVKALQEERFAALSAEQLSAVVVFLEWFAKVHASDCTVHDLREALTYWQAGG